MPLYMQCLKACLKDCKYLKARKECFRIQAWLYVSLRTMQYSWRRRSILVRSPSNCAIGISQTNAPGGGKCPTFKRPNSFSLMSSSHSIRLTTGTPASWIALYHCLIRRHHSAHMMETHFLKQFLLNVVLAKALLCLSLSSFTISSDNPHDLPLPDSAAFHQASFLMFISLILLEQHLTLLFTKMWCGSMVDCINWFSAKHGWAYHCRI